MAIVGTTTILVGTVAGRMYRIVRGAAGWGGATVTPLARPTNGYISDIAVSGTTGKTLWVSSSRLSGGHVFRSTNGGTSWTDRSGNLPATAVNALVVDPKNSRRLFIGTDRGVWRTTNSGTSWTGYSNGLPNAIVGDLILHAATRVLRAGTRSRGAWEVTV
jgi:ligand-binding sensor domain-containing protein